MMIALMMQPVAGMAAGTRELILETDSGEHRYQVEVATTYGERALGLMFRRTLPDTAGMLFLYDPPQRVGMWMRNTVIPLDMIFISGDGRVHRIQANTEPFSTDLIPSGGEVGGVLELNAGQADKIGLKRGDRVVYPGLSEGTQP
ncbi:MAG TPA: DUF192 domain-containing protein [Methyloceanibacter sp.]|nr:DUF192 domain-containing protein [Methyloceanibacter sp.]